MVACNDSANTEGTKNDTAATAVTPDTTAGDHHHMADAATEVTPLPAIPDGAKVFFVNLKDGQKIKSPFKVQMGVSGIALDSAGAIKPASGHHHILIDAGDSTHLHFGNAQKEAEVKLTPGEHKLTLQYADGIHRSYGGKLAKSVTVTVQ
jgi:hypothetical protein